MSARTFKLIGAAGAAALAVGVMAGPAVAADQSSCNYTCFNGAPRRSRSPWISGRCPPSIDGRADRQEDHQRRQRPPRCERRRRRARRRAGTQCQARNRRDHDHALQADHPEDHRCLRRAASLDIPATGAFTIKPDQGRHLHGQGRRQRRRHPGLERRHQGATTSRWTARLRPTASNVFGTIAVSKDASKTATKASYNAKKDVATGTAKVAGAKFKLAGTGKVKFTLKKGTKTIGKAITAKLKKGKATAAFKNVKAKGSYSITASFKGDAGLKGSSGKATFKVK